MAARYMSMNVGTVVKTFWIIIATSGIGIDSQNGAPAGTASVVWSQMKSTGGTSLGATTATRLSTQVTAPATSSETTASAGSVQAAGNRRERSHNTWTTCNATASSRNVPKM